MRCHCWWHRCFVHRTPLRLSPHHHSPPTCHSAPLVTRPGAVEPLPSGACMHAELRPDGVAVALTLAVVQVGVPYVMHKLARIHRRMVEEAVTNPAQAHSHDGSSIDASGQVCITRCLPFCHTDALLSFIHLLHTRQTRRTVRWMQHVRAWFLRYFPMVNSGYMLLQLVYHVRSLDLAGATSTCVSLSVCIDWSPCVPLLDCPSSHAQWMYAWGKTPYFDLWFRLANLAIVRMSPSDAVRPPPNIWLPRHNHSCCCHTHQPRLAPFIAAGL